MVKNILLLLAAMAGCILSTHGQVTITDSFKVDGIYRSYRLYIPPGIEQTSSPLVLNMHGLGSNSFEQQYYSLFMPIADTAGFYVVMPQGTSYNGTAFWNVGLPGTPQVDDVKFLSELIDTISAHYMVDKSRVYATGMSNGGYMAHMLGVVLNSRIAAIASVTGSMVPQLYATAKPGRAVPALQVHGTADGTVPFTGFAYGVHIDSLMKFWVRNNACVPVPKQTAIPNINMNDGSTATRYVWSNGLHGATVELFKVTGGGHTWPGAPVNIGVTNHDFSASREIWRFFSQYRLDQFTAVRDLRMIQTPALTVSPNPSVGMLHVAAPAAGTSSITNMGGKLLIRTTARDIDIAALPPGTYLLQYKGKEFTGSARFVKE